MAKKSLQQLEQLAKNPHYKMTEEEQAELRRYQNGDVNPDLETEKAQPRKGPEPKTRNVKNKNVVEKHDVDMDTVQPKKIHEGGPNKA